MHDLGYVTLCVGAKGFALLKKYEGHNMMFFLDGWQTLPSEVGSDSEYRLDCHVVAEK